MDNIINTMKTTVDIDRDKLLEFSNKKVMTKKGLSKLFNCSGRTVQRKLKQWKAVRSYNHNGQYYAMLSIVEFDVSGLWCYNSVCFSKHGNLSETVVFLICESPSGMTASQISDTLHLDKKSFLTFFKNISKIQRENISGSHVYFSVDELIYQRQKANRTRIENEISESHLTDIDIIRILTEKIQYPESDEFAISANLTKQGVQVSSGPIVELFERLGIKKKLRVSGSR